MTISVIGGIQTRERIRSLNQTETRERKRERERERAGGTVNHKFNRIKGPLQPCGEMEQET